LLEPVTKYGDTYVFYDFEDDKLSPEYADIQEAEILLIPEFQDLEIGVSHALGF